MGLNIADLTIGVVGLATDERLADEHAGDQGNIAPAVTIAGVPSTAAELAVILHDPDAPLPNGFTHWTVYGLSPQTAALDIAALSTARQGPNGMGEIGYSGPWPPAGHGQHHYYFWVYALDVAVVGEPTREQFLIDYADHIVEQNRFVATYSN